jgi:ribulose-phosphate 3-epimerase
MQKVQIAPSILSADFSNLETEVRTIEKAGAHMLHIDVMDGHFVNNITFGPALVKSIRDKTGLPFDVHLMIDPVTKYITDFSDAGADIITIHVEVQDDILGAIELIRSLGKKAGVAINPETKIDKILPFIDIIDQVIVMSVHPGFAGQSFIRDSIDRIRKIKALIASRDILVEVDGGIGSSCSQDCINAGCDILVAGSSIFNTNNYERSIREIIGS